MAEFNAKDAETLDQMLTHGLIFPDAFKDRIRDAILDGLRGVNYKNVPGLNPLRGRKLFQWSGTVGGFTGLSPGSPAWAHLSQSTIGGGPYVDRIVTGIADGKYMILWGSQISCGGSPGARIGLSINGDTPVDTQSLQAISSSSTRARMMVRTLKNSDNNSIEFMVRNDIASSAFFDYPQITLIKISDV